jgi:hypothetical protein
VKPLLVGVKLDAYDGSAGGGIEDKGRFTENGKLFLAGTSADWRERLYRLTEIVAGRSFRGLKGT